MADRVPRSVYSCLLRLHPPAFRNRFAEEMMSTFDEAAGHQHAAGLLFDCFVSLTRQWLFRPTSWRVPVPEIAPVFPCGLRLFAWDRIDVAVPRLPVKRWMQGGVISTAFFVAIGLVAVQSPARRPRTSPLPAGGGANPSRAFAGPGAQSSRAHSGRAGDSAYAIASGPASANADNQSDEGQPPANSQDSSAPHAFFANQAQGAPPEIPDTPAGKEFSAWFNAFNAGDRAQIAEFQKHFKNPDPRENPDGELRFRRMTGGFSLRKIEESTATKITGLVQERGSDQFARFVLEVEPNPPHLITNWDLRIVPIPADFAIPPMSEEQVVEAAKARVDDLARQDRFSGAVLVTKNGKTVFSGAYGLADREKKTPNTLDTKFRIGSMNKMFTATSIMQLVQAGKVRLNDPLGKYIADYPNKDVAAKVTIYNLLTHTGGTGDIFGPQFEQHRKDLRTLDDYVKLYGTRGLEFTPGSRWEYSNYGFLLLGVVIERVTGKSYYDYVAEHICAPAGMTSTGSLPEDATVPLRSTGYTMMSGDTPLPNTDTLPYRGTSAGGGYSTVEDLQRFASALLDHKLLNAQYTEMLTTGKVDTPGGGKYAFGFDDEGSGATRHFGHGGGAPGMNGELQIYPQSGYVIAVLSNLDPPAATRVSSFIGNRLPTN